MELWILLGIASSFAFGSLSIIDRYFLQKEKNLAHPMVFAVTTSITSALVVTPVFFLSGTAFSITRELLLLSFLIAGISTVSRYMYYFALRNGEASYIAPFAKFMTVFSVIFGFLFLGESISLMLILGSALIFIGGYFVLEKQNSVWIYLPRIDLPVILTIGYSLLVSLRSVVDTIVVKAYPLLLVMLLTRYTNVITDSTLTFSMRKEETFRFFRHLKEDKKSLAIFLLRGTISILAFITFYYALSKGLLSKVMPLANIDTLVVAFFAVLFLGEKIGKQRALGTILTIIGAALVALG